MSSRTKRITCAIALLVAFAMAQIFLPVSLAGLAGNAGAPTPQATAVLSTGGNQPISVNGASAMSGATIMSGAMIETPRQVGATVNFRAIFFVDWRQREVELALVIQVRYGDSRLCGVGYKKGTAASY